MQTRFSRMSSSVNSASAAVKTPACDAMQASQPPPTHRRQNVKLKSWNGRNRIRTEEGGCVDGGGGAGVDPGEPRRHDARAADDAQVPRLPQHGHHQRGEDAEAGAGADDVGHPRAPLPPLERPRERRLRINLQCTSSSPNQTKEKETFRQPDQVVKKNCGRSILVSLTEDYSYWLSLLFVVACSIR